MRQVKTSSLEWGVGCLGALLGVLMLIVPHQFGGGFWFGRAVMGAVLLAGGAGLLGVAVVAVQPTLRLGAHLLAAAAFLMLASGYAARGAWTATVLHGVLGAGTALAPVLSLAGRRRPGLPGTDLLVVLVAVLWFAAQQLLTALARRQHHLATAVDHLLRLLDEHGRDELALAIAEALAAGSPHPETVRLVLDRRRAQRGQAPPLPVELPDDPRLRDLVVVPHPLADYDPEDES